MSEWIANAADFKPDLILKPIIRELARTQVCFPNLKLLVDRISIVTLPRREQTTENEAYRLYLTDGEKSIQAVLKRKLHKQIHNADVREGSFVILRNYRLEYGKKLGGDGSVIYIVIEDFYSIGEDMREDSDGIRHDRYMELMRTPQHQSKKLAEGEYGSTKRLLFESADNDHKSGEVHEGANDSTPYGPKNEPPRKDDVEEQDQDLVSSQLLSPSISPTSPMKPEKRDGAFEEIDPNLAPRVSNFSKPEGEDVETKNKTYEKPSPSRVSHSMNLNRSTIENHRELSNDKTQKDRKPIIPMKRGAPSPDSGSMTSLRNKELNNRFTPTKKVNNQITSSFRRSPRFPADPSLGKRKNLLPIKRPLNIRSLDSITGQHAARNKVYDFFAVVYSVEPSVVKPAVMPLKRDIRITDPSTEKKVLVSVFVDPVSFKPAVGTIALFRSLTTHEWDRGMLNAYPQHCEGRDWFIVDPSGIEGCDVKRLREWWEKKSVELTESLQQHPS